MGSGSKVDACDVAIEDGQQGLNKFHSRLWSKLGLLQKRREDMLGEGDYGGGDVVNKPLAESWHKRGFCGFGLSAIEVEKRYSMVSGDNRDQKKCLLASPQYASVLKLRQNHENNRGQKPLLHCVYLTQNI